MLTNAPAGTIEVLMRIANDTCVGGDLARWAVQALSDDFDSPALRQLAALDERVSRDEAGPLFKRALNEIGVAVPQTNDEICRAFLKLIAGKILDDRLDSSAALSIIHREVIDPLHHPADLMAWCYLCDDLDPRSFDSLDAKALDATVRALARDTIAGTTERWQQSVIFAFGDDGGIEVFTSIDDAKRDWEPIDVESGIVVFYDDDGTWLKPDFIKPNKRQFFGIILTHGEYTLVREAAPPEVDPIDVALAEAVYIKPNAYFNSVDAILRHIRARQRR